MMANTENLLLALGRLDVVEGKRSRISDLAERLAFVSETAAINERPAAQSAGESTAAVEVERLADLATKFINHVNGMHRNSLAVFEGGDCPHPMAMSEKLRKIVTAAAEAKPGPREKNQRKARAAETAKQALAIYEFLTNQPATVRVRVADNSAYGPFLTFLTELFEALGIKASAENWARQAINSARRNDRQKN